MAKTSGNILLVDDDEFVLLSVKILLEGHFTKVVTLNNPERLPAMLERETFDVAVLDMNFRQGDTSGNQGLFWLRKINTLSPDTQVILMTAFADISVAVESIKEGARDFIVKPWENEKLVATVRTAYALSQEKKKVRSLKTQQRSIVSALSPHVKLIGKSPAIESLRKTIEKVAPTEAEVLILGQNGTGKEVLAREIHARSSRADAVFMSVDVGALSETIFESELFGHRKGAFTDAREDRIGRFEAAAGGTIFLDEIGNLSMALQSKLLTVLQRKQIVRLGTNDPINLDIRIIAATNRDPHRMAAEGQFREDLMYRLNTVEIMLPSLQERTDDIGLLAQHFLDIFRTKYQKLIAGLDSNLISYLKSYHRPGNVRELQHAMERAVIMCDTNALSERDFNNFQRDKNQDFNIDNLNLERLEAWAIRKAIAKHGGNISHAAEELGLSRGALYRRLETYGI